MQIVFLGDLLDGFDAFERFQGYTGFEFRIVSAAFCFHGWWFLFSALQTPPPPHFYSLTTGPISGDHLYWD
jgi:hypothetical protein